MRSSPGLSSGFGASSYTSCSGPPRLCNRMAFIVISPPLVFSSREPSRRKVSARFAVSLFALARRSSSASLHHNTWLKPKRHHGIGCFLLPLLIECGDTTIVVIKDIGTAPRVSGGSVHRQPFAYARGTESAEAIKGSVSLFVL